jgi:hypothetical protein
LTVFRHQGEGGTYVVPGHGYLSDEHEVVEYRDMVVIVRDRVKAMKDAGATLAQIQAARLTADYDTVRFQQRRVDHGDVRPGGLRYAVGPANDAVGPRRSSLRGRERPTRYV